MKLSTLEAFAEALKSKFLLPGPASPEDQLKPVVTDLLKSVGVAFGLTVETRTETHLSDHKVRPDIAIYVGGLICGYIELKAPGLGADAPKLKGDHNKKQWEKLKGLPNLIYTDGREWTLYRTGERPDGQPIVRLHDDPTENGRAAVTKDDAERLERLFRDFLGWQPNVPHSPSGLAKYLAPLTRFLRSEVESAIGQAGSAVELLANEWRQFFFPDSDNAKFADAYAQTVTYAMLLARLSGAAKLDPTVAAKTLDKNNGLLARALELLGHPDARKELAVGFEMLQRSLEALNPHDFLKSKPDLWLYFYEDFLAAYDSKLRKDYGVYYTPREVVELQVRFCSELLEKKFGKKLGFADDGVVFLDPAVGTGTYPVAAVKHGLEKVRARSGAGAVPDHLKALIESDAFRSLNGGMLDLFNVIAAHPKMSDNNRTVAKIILRAVNLDAGYACISHAMICEQSGLGVNAVRGSTRKLIAAGFFKTIRPTPEEWDNGEMALKYVPQFSRLSRPRS